MRKWKWKRLVAFLSLILVFATVGSIIISTTRTADAAATGVTITFGDGSDGKTPTGSWLNYTWNTKGVVDGVASTTNGNAGWHTAHDLERSPCSSAAMSRFLVRDTNGSGSYDPQLSMLVTGPGVNYTIQENDIIQVYYRVDAFTGTTRPTNIRAFLSFDGANYSQGNSISCSADFSDAKLNTMQTSSAVLNSFKGKKLTHVRIDLPDSGTYTSITFRIQSIYVGPPSGAPQQKGITFTFNNADGTKLGSIERAYNSSIQEAYNAWKASNGVPTYGTKESTIDTAAEVNATEATYDFKGWRDNTSSALTGGTIHDMSLRYTANKTLYACYDANYRVRFYSKDKATILGWEYVRHNARPSSVPDAPDVYNNDKSNKYVHTGNWERYRSAQNDTTGPYTDAFILSDVPIQSGYVDFTATYNTQHRVRYYTKDKASLLATDYVAHNGYIKSVRTTLPTVSNISVNSNEYLGHKGTWTRDFLVSATANTTGLSAERVLGNHTGENMNVMVSEAMDIIAEYDTYYAVRFYKTGGGQFAYADYITGESKNGWYKQGSKINSRGLPTPETVSGKTFVSWVSTGNTTAGNGNPTADSVGAIDETTYTVNGPLWLHPRYLSNSFVGSTTDGLVVKRTVTEVDSSNYEYQVRVELYSYGKAITGAMDIYDSYMGTFQLAANKGAQIFFQAYLGNGKFDESALNHSQAGGYENLVTRTTNSGDYGYVYDKSTASDVWKTVKFNGSEHIAYNWVHVRFFDPNFKTYAAGESGSTKSQYAKNTDNVRNGMVCNEYNSANTTNNPYKTFPKGFRIVLLYNIKLNENGTMGGNNYDISHGDYMKIVANGKTYNFHSNQYATTCVYTDDEGTKQTTTAVEPNVNIEIKYDFVVHDYYMDLLDYNNQKPGETSNQRVIGLLTALRNDKRTNHEAIYGRMYSHGNVNVYKDEAYNPGRIYDMPNTDIDGTRNSRVKIYYTVTHENGKLVYATQILGNDKIEDSHTQAHVDTSKEWADVDFTKDHKVTVSVKVEAISKDPDSFGNDPDTTPWNGEAEAYFFAPRFIVADYGRTSAVDLQREGMYWKTADNAKFTFYETPSYVFRQKYIADGTYTKDQTEPIRLYTTSGELVTQAVSGESNRNFKTGIGATIRTRPTAVTTAMYGFNITGDGYSDSVSPSTHKFLEGVQKFSYTTDVINHLKYSEDTSITRNVYVIPANNILYHELFMDFTKGTNADTTNASTATWKNFGSKINYVIYDNTDLYGYNSVIKTVTNEAHNDYGQVSKYAQPNSTTRNVYGNFTFTGTGFEILSRTAPDTGVLVAQVYDASGTLVKRILVDNYLENKDIVRVYDFYDFFDKITN